MTYHTTIPADLTLEQAVANGIALLDEHGPDDWRDRINVECISFPNQQLCPLGQVYGAFAIGCRVLRAATRANYASTSYGFMSHYGGPSGSTHWSDQELADEWRRQLRGGT